MASPSPSIFEELLNAIRQDCTYSRETSYKRDINLSLENGGIENSILGQKFRETSSLRRVNDPVIRAWHGIWRSWEIRFPGRRNHPDDRKKRIEMVATDFYTSQTLSEIIQPQGRLYDLHDNP
jgi:hypothetical protein